jgi:zinc/manganese transport system substrate-binding protein
VRSFTVYLLAALILTGACSSETSPQPADEVLIVATTSILGDVASAAFGDSARVITLLTGTNDPHSYRASPNDVALLGQADVVLANGLGLEEALYDLLEAAIADGANVLFAGNQIEPLYTDTNRRVVDPHFWLDPLRMEVVITALGDELARLEPDNAAAWRTRADAYGSTLRRVHAGLVDLVDSLPQNRRALFTNHDSLRYFADRYGFVIVSSLIPGSSTIAEPSAADLAAAIDYLEGQEISAIFADAAGSKRLAEIVAAEVSRDVVVVELHSGGLGPPESGADTYIGYLETNAGLIVKALAA